MATDAGGTRPLTQYVAGNGQSAVSYQLPAGLIQYVQSVVATFDTSAAGDVQPLLTVTDDANIVVADKQQGQSIDAGGSGRATWALRLTDEAPTFDGIRFNRVNTGGYLIINAATLMQLAVTAAGDPFSLTTNGGPIDVQSNAGAIRIKTDGADAGDIEVFAGLGTVDVRGDTIELKSTGKINLRVITGQSVTVFNNAGHPIFRVDENGDLHGLTGKALVFDL